MNDYKTLNHSKFLLIYHIIFEISKKSDFDIQEMEVDKDHLHLMVTSVPKISPLQIVRKLKQETTVGIWKLYRECFHRNRKEID